MGHCGRRSYWNVLKVLHVRATGESTALSLAFSVSMRPKWPQLAFRGLCRRALRWQSGDIRSGAPPARLLAPPSLEALR